MIILNNLINNHFTFQVIQNLLQFLQVEDNYKYHKCKFKVLQMLLIFIMILHLLILIIFYI